MLRGGRGPEKTRPEALQRPGLVTNTEGVNVNRTANKADNAIAARSMSAQMEAQMDDDRNWFMANPTRRFRLRVPFHKEMLAHAEATGSSMTDVMSRAVVFVANTPLAFRFLRPVHIWGGASQVERCNTDPICALIWKGLQGTADQADALLLRRLLVEAGVLQ